MDEALAWLYSNKNKVKDIQLKRISFILNALNLNPGYKIIEVAGTNGKGSTVAFLKGILAKAGYRVGSFSSPFILCFNERIAINNQFISDEEVLYYTRILYDYQNYYMNTFNDRIPFFELMLIMALMYFKNNNCDIAILECGIGGRYDAVNAISADLAIITSIGYDHMNTLGNTLAEITYHKLGIGRANKPLLISMDNCSDIIKYCSEKSISLYNTYNEVKKISYDSFSYKNNKYNTSMLGDFQFYNASLAIEASLLIDSNISYDSLYNGILEAKLRGRMELISTKPLIIADGAHNISAFLKIIPYLLGFNKKISVLFSGLSDKAYASIPNYLKGYVNKFYFTYIDDSRDRKSVV